MPKPGKDDHKFKNLTARWYVPRVIYFDLESLLLPVYGPQPDPRKSSTQTIEIHQPCGYALAVIEFGKKDLLKFELKRGPNVMEELISSLESLARQIYVEKRKYYTFTGITDQEREDATICWICENDFSDNDQVVLDHCHYTNKFLGWAHNECNVNRKTTNYIPVVAHNLSNYDLHFIIKALAKSDSENTFSVIPASEEKYISLTISVYIKTYTDKNGKIKKHYENLRFIDSYRFMLASLAKLVDNLPNEKFFLLENYFEKLGHSREKVSLLKQKGHYPYSYFNSFEKFRETRLPPRAMWKNSLTGGDVSVSRSEYNHALKVFTELKCGSLGDYHDLYLTTDVLLLASVFEAFREVCYQTYGLDCACYFTASNLSGDAFLKVCKPELKLLTDREHLDLVQRMIRGGMSSIYARRFYKANNKYLDDFSPSEPSSYILNIDANNLYGGIMKHCPLPLNDFSIVEKSLADILLTSETSEWGYIVEVNLTIPEELHDFFADYPLAPSREVVDIGAMSNEQVDMLGKLGITTLPKVPKLLQTLHPKEGYVLHYLTLKLYHELGMKITHLGKVLQFRQSHWMAPFVDLNTRLRKAAVNKFQENFYKLIVNSAFGKTMESKLGRKKLEIVRNERELLQKTALSTMKSFQIIDDQLATISFSVTKILWDKPMIVGATILDLAKRFMFQFHYQKMKPNLNLELLYSDTDSFIYAIKTDDVYRDLEKIKADFDFSNYDKDHFLFEDTNKKVVLKFKDETGGKPIREFIALKPKLYSVVLNGK